ASSPTPPTSRAPRVAARRPARSATTAWMTTVMAGSTAPTRTVNHLDTITARAEVATCVVTTSSACLIATMARTTATKPTWIAAALVATPDAKLARPARSTRTAHRAFAPAPVSREANHETNFSFRINAPRPGVRGPGAGAGGLDAGSHGDQVRPGTHQSRPGSGQGPARAGASPVEPACGPGRRRAERARAGECGQRAESGARRRAGHARRVLRLPVPVLRPLLRDDAPHAQAGLHRHGQAALRVSRLPARSAAPQCPHGRRGRALRRRAGQVLGDARRAVPESAGAGPVSARRVRARGRCGWTGVRAVCRVRPVRAPDRARSHGRRGGRRAGDARLRDWADHGGGYRGRYADPRRPAGGEVPPDHRAVAGAADAGREPRFPSEPRSPEVMYASEPIEHRRAGRRRPGVPSLPRATRAHRAHAPRGAHREYDARRPGGPPPRRLRGRASAGGLRGAGGKTRRHRRGCAR